MKYTVSTSPKADAELMNLWMAATDKAELSAAANTVDRLLQVRPHLIGVELFDNVKRFSVPPLVVDFEIVDDDRIVYILQFKLVADTDG